MPPASIRPLRSLPFKPLRALISPARGNYSKEVNMTKLKRTCAFFTCVVMLMMSFSALSLVGADKPYEFPAGSSPVSVTLDGKPILTGQTALINSVTYVPVRAFSELLGADSVTWNASTSTATIKKGTLSIFVSGGALYVGANGRYFFTVEKILNINNRLFVPIRAIASALSATVEWDNATRSVAVTSSKRTLTSGSTYYNSDDLYWLSRIISAEAAGEPLVGQIAVGNVVLNRKNSKQYPNSIYGVIFDRKHGTQFSPVSMGTIYNTPSATSVIAAKICLEGYSVDTDILFFMNPRIATTNWISKNRPYAFTIGNHHFYY